MTVELSTTSKAQLVNSPDAAHCLAGLTLGEAFFKCVLQDADVQLLAKEVAKKGHEVTTVLNDGRYPGPYIEYNWPIDVTSSELAYQFVRPIVMFLEDPLPKAPVEITRLCDVIIDRLQGLRALLSSGRLVARGTHVTTGNVVSLDQFQWKRKGMLLDVQNSDISDGQKHPPILRWTGLALHEGSLPSADERRTPPQNRGVDPLSTFHVKPTGYDDLRLIAAEPPKASRKGITRVEASAKDVTECLQWLVGLMRKSPEERISIETLWEDAQERWPGLSKNAFLKARTDAIEASGARAWAAGGAPRKQSSNRRS